MALPSLPSLPKLSSGGGKLPSFSGFLKGLGGSHTIVAPGPAKPMPSFTPVQAPAVDINAAARAGGLILPDNGPRLEAMLPQLPKLTPKPGVKPVPTASINIERLIHAESSGKPTASAVGKDGNTYHGLMGMGEAAWNDVNEIRKRKGLPQLPFSKATDPAVNREYGKTYLEERVPELLRAQGKAVTPETQLAFYGGWMPDFEKAGGDIAKMPKNAQTYFRNVLGETANADELPEKPAVDIQKAMASGGLLPELPKLPKQEGSSVGRFIRGGVEFLKEAIDRRGEIKQAAGEAFNRGTLQAASALETVGSVALRKLAERQRSVRTGSEHIAKFFESTADRLSKVAQNDRELSAAGIQVNDERKFSEKIKDPRFIAEGIAGNLPNMLATLGAGIVGTLVGGPAGGTAAAFATGASIEGGYAYQDAKDHGLTDEKAEKVGALVGVANGILEYIPVGRLLEKLPGGDGLKRTIMARITSGIIQAAEEGATESIQEIVSNAVARTYDENRQLFAGVPESALFGALMGGGTDVAVGVIGDGKAGLSIEDVSKGKETAKVYHGTGSTFDAFDESRRGTITGAKSAKGAVWFTDDPEVARAYAIYAAETGPVTELMEKQKELERVAQKSGLQSDWEKYDELTRKIEEIGAYDPTYERRKHAVVKEAELQGDFLLVDAKGETPQGLSDDGGLDSWLNEQLDEARRQGKDGVIFQNLDDAAGLSNKPATHYAVFDTKTIKTKPAEPTQKTPQLAPGEAQTVEQRIAQRGIKIIVSEKTKGSHGRFSLSERTITIPKHLPPGYDRNEIVAHELGHAVHTDIAQESMDQFNELAKELRPEIEPLLKRQRYGWEEKRATNNRMMQGHFELFADLYGLFLREPTKLPARIREYFDGIQELTPAAAPASPATAPVFEAKEQPSLLPEKKGPKKDYYPHKSQQPHFDAVERGDVDFLVKEYVDGHGYPSVNGMEFWLETNGGSDALNKKILAAYKKTGAAEQPTFPKEEDEGDTEEKDDDGDEGETQEARVAKVVAKGPKSIKEVAEQTKILEPNVRRILGVGAKEGTFTRVAPGVYELTRDGKVTAYVEAGDSVEVLARMAAEGKKYHSVILDPAYYSKALIGGNRKPIRFEFIKPEAFSKVMKSVAQLVDDDAHVYLMLSGARTAQGDMLKYANAAVEAGFTPVGEGSYKKLTKDGKPHINIRGEDAAAERIIVMSKSGKLREGEIAVGDLKFQFVRPSIRKSYSTEKPTELMDALIRRSTLEGETVLDPFAGSGVTGEAAIKAGRTPTLVEKSEEVVKERILPRVERAAPPARLALEEFSKLPAEQQEEAFEQLSLMDQEKAMFGEELDKRDTFAVFADEFASGKRKIRVGDDMKSEAKHALGRADYMRVFTKDPSAPALDEAMQEYNNARGTDHSVSDFLDEIATALDRKRGLREQFREQRAAAIQARAVERAELKTVKEQQKFLADLQKDIYTKLTGRRFTAGQVARVKERYEARIAKIKTAKDILDRRRLTIRTVREHFGLTDQELNSITRQDIRLMDNFQFKKFIDDIRIKAESLATTRDARNRVAATIQMLDLKHVENLQQALQLPASIEKMDLKQLAKLDEALQGAQTGDDFLSLRKLQTVDRTDLKGIRTLREAKERLAKELGVPVEEVSNIKVGALDRFRYDTALARQNPFYEMMVDSVNGAMLQAEGRVHETHEKINELITAARKSRKRSVVERLVPQDKSIFDYLEAPADEKPALAAAMSQEELIAANYIQAKYAEMRDYLVQLGTLNRYRQDYITHIRRGFLEGWKEDGLLTAFNEVFSQYKQDEAVFQILDDTGKVLPLEKFFQYSMKRSGELKPTANVARAFMTYLKAFEKKAALDSIVPKLDIYAHTLTPVMKTPRGLEFDRTLKTFVNEWVNNKKGRTAKIAGIEQGGTIDLLLRAGKAFTSLIDLAFNIPVGIAARGGEAVTNFTMLGTKRYAQGLIRTRTAKGQAILEKYKEFTGRSVFEELADADADLAGKLMKGAFGLFHDATYRANRTFLLGSLTEQELNTGVIDPKRLAELRREMGRYRVVEGSKSILGSTSVGGTLSQYRTWAVPILSTTLSNIGTMKKLLKSGQYKTLLGSRELQELARAVAVSTLVYVLGAAVIGDDDDDESVTGSLLKRIRRDALSLISVWDLSFWSQTPRLMTFVKDLNEAISQLYKLEKYKDSDEYKGTNAIMRTLTPRSARPLMPESLFYKNKEKKRTLLPTLPALPKMPKLPKIPRVGPL